MIRIVRAARWAALEEHLETESVARVAGGRADDLHDEVTALKSELGPLRLRAELEHAGVYRYPHWLPTNPIAEGGEDR